MLTHSLEFRKCGRKETRTCSQRPWGGEEGREGEHEGGEWVGLKGLGPGKAEGRVLGKKETFLGESEGRKTDAGLSFGPEGKGKRALQRNSQTGLWSKWSFFLKTLDCHLLSTCEKYS